MNRKTKINNDFLIRSSIAITTNKKYEKALANFKQYLLSNYQIKLHQLSPSELDILLSNYIHYLHSMNISMSTAINTLCSIRRSTAFGSLLHHSSLAIKGWIKIHNDNYKLNRPPLTWEVTILITIVMAKSGFYSAAIGTLLSFHTYLRINEMCSLRICDILFTGDARLGYRSSSNQLEVYGSLRLNFTKTGRNQQVTILDSRIAELLKQWIEHVKSNANVISTNLVFSLTTSKYRSIFHSSCIVLGLQSVGYTPHSLRHGGCTFDHMRGVHVQDLMQRGRWKSQTALTTYVQAGSVLLFDTHLSDQMFKAARIFDQQLVKVLNLLKQW